MKVFSLECRENYQTLSREYRIDFLGLLRFYPRITHERGVLGGKPIWLSFIQAWIQTFCKHEWAKVGREYIQGYFLGDSTTFYQNHKCKLCAKERITSRIEHDYP